MLVNQLQLMSLSDTGRPVMGLVSKGSCTLGWVASLTFNTMFILNHWIFLLLKLSGFLASAFFFCVTLQKNIHSVRTIHTLTAMPLGFL